MAGAYALVCPVCVEIWAKLPLESPDGRYRPITEIHAQPCNLHSIDEWNVAGSLLVRYGPDGLPRDPLLLDYMPESLLEREYEVHIEHYLRWR